TIADAIVKVVTGQMACGIYDLMNMPQWSWRELYRYEAETLQLPFMPTLAPAAPSANSRRSLIRALGRIAGHPMVHQHGSKLVAYLPEGWNRRAQAWWYRRRAGAEIGALLKDTLPAEHLSWVSNSRRPAPGLTATHELLQTRPYENF